MVVSIKTANKTAATVKTVTTNVASVKSGLVVTNKADVEKYSKQIIASYGKGRKLVQDLSLAVIAHMAEHGDWTVIEPLTKAMSSLGNNLYGPWIDWIMEHSWLRLADDVKPSKRLRADPSKLWARDKAMKPADNKPLLEKARANRTVEKRGKKVSEPNNFWTFKPVNDNASEAKEVNVADGVKRFTDRMVAAIVADACIGPDGKPIKLADVLKLVRAMAATIDKDASAGLKAKDVANATKITGERAPVKAKANDEPAAKAA
jgi:hypothetical protein